MKTIHSKEYRLLIDYLKECRCTSTLTQQELAGLLGTDQTYVSKYESYQRRLDIIELREICTELGISLIDFIKEFESKLKEESNNGS